MEDALPETSAPVFATDSRTITALGERVAAVETKVNFLQSVVDRISANLHGMNQELMKIQIMSTRNGDSLDTIKSTVTEFRAWVGAEFVTAAARQEVRDQQITAAVTELSNKRYIMEGAWG